MHVNPPHDIPTILRQARQAVGAKQYEKAELLYAAALTHEEIKDNLDIKVRYAFCVEQSSSPSRAIALYQDIHRFYMANGEQYAATALAANIAKLQAATQPRRKQAIRQSKPQPKAVPQRQQATLAAAQASPDSMVKKTSQPVKAAGQAPVQAAVATKVQAAHQPIANNAHIPPAPPLASSDQLALQISTLELPAFEAPTTDHEPVAWLSTLEIEVIPPTPTTASSRPTHTSAANQGIMFHGTIGGNMPKSPDAFNPVATIKMDAFNADQ